MKTLTTFNQRAVNGYKNFKSVLSLRKPGCKRSGFPFREGDIAFPLFIIFGPSLSTIKLLPLMRKTKSTLPKAFVTFQPNNKTKVKIDLMSFVKKKLKGEQLTANEIIAEIIILTRA
jgi:hypothetical protein